MGLVHMNMANSKSTSLRIRKSSIFVLTLALLSSLTGCWGGGSNSNPLPELAPIGVFAVSGTGRVTISWTPVPGATSYNIYWGTTPGITNASNHITNATSPFDHSNLTTGSTYFYRVGSKSSSGEKLSDEVFTYLYANGAPTGIFTATGSMIIEKYSNSSTLLPNGTVLFAGGISLGLTPGGSTSTAELFNPTTGAFTATGSLIKGRSSHTATLLPNGKVLIVGGLDSGNSLSSAELYDPTLGTFTATGSLVTGRSLHTATLLPNGKVLVAGGVASGNSISSAELYDPAIGTFTTTGNMNVTRYEHTATILTDGKVLMIGDTSSNSNSAEIYDPATGSFILTGSMTTKRPWHTATLLPSGKVLVTGGYNGTTYDSAEIYDPLMGGFTSASNMKIARYSHSATLLPNGKVLVTGGRFGAGMNTIALASAEIYDPETGVFSVTGNMTTWRFSHTAMLLPNGNVLVSKGTADLFQ